MSKSPSKSAATRAPIHITCYAPDAQQVFIAGAFNDWDPTGLAMEKNAGGEWATDVDLAPGRYEYKFVVDGVWCCEPHLRNDGCGGDDRVPNALGTMNRVLLVR